MNIPKYLQITAGLLLATLALSPAYAQVGKGFTIDYPHVEKLRLSAEQDNNVGISFRMIIPANSIRQNQTILMTPVLANEQGERSLIPINVTGSRKNKSDRRKRTLSGKDMAIQMTTIKGQAGILDYKVSTPYATWMSRSPLELYLDQTKIGYHKITFLGRIQLTTSQIEYGAETHLSIPPFAYSDTLFARIDSLIALERFDALRHVLPPADTTDKRLSNLHYLLNDPYARPFLGNNIRITGDQDGARLLIEKTARHSPAQALAEQESFIGNQADYRIDRIDAQYRKGGLTVYFPLGQSRIDPRYMDNQKALERILRAVETIQNDPHPKSLGIRILGQASPEGSVPHNIALSQKRGETLRDYLVKNTRLPAHMFDVVAIGAAWDQLREMVAQDTLITHKQEILDVIDRVPVWDSRTQTGRMGSLWKIGKEVPYRYMLKYMFPRLRNATYIKIYIETQPDPASSTIDQAIRLIAERRYDQALPLLESIQGDPRAWIPLGACYAMTGRHTEASVAFGIASNQSAK